MQKAIKIFDAIIYWSIIIIPFSICISLGVTSSFMGLLLFAFLIKKILKKERPFVFTAISLPFLLLTIVSLISFKNSIDYHSSFKGMLKLLQAAMLFLICADQIKDKRQVMLIVVSVVCGASLSSIDAFWQLTCGRDFIRGYNLIFNIGLKRATAAFPNSNVFGVYLSAITPLVLGVALFYYKGKKKILMLLLGVLATAGIAVTYSRGTALALYVSVLFMSLYRRNKSISAILIIILLVFPFVMPQKIKDYAKQVHYNPLIFMLNTDRISIYRNTFNMIKHHPLIGVGVNTYSENYHIYKLPEPLDAMTNDSMYAHNHFLQMAGEIGLIGLGLFLWLLFRLFKRLLQIYRGLQDEYLRVVCLSVLACLLAFLVNGLTETSLYYSRVAMIFWYLIGFGLALGKFIHAHRA